MIRIFLLMALFSLAALSATAAPQKVGPKDLAKIKTATLVVQVDGRSPEPVEFKNGEYHTRHNDLEYTFNVVEEPILVTKSRVAYVVQGLSRGGTGYWMQIKVVDLKQDPAIEIKSFPRIKEDRVKIEKISIRGKTLVLDILKHGGTDALCCPTKKDKIKYEL